MGAVVRRPAERRGQLAARRGRGAGHVGEVEGVERGLQRQQDLDLARVVLAELGGELVEHLDVGEQLAHLGVDVDDRRGHQPVDGVGRRGELVAERGRAPAGQHVRVGGGLDVQVDALARK